MIPDEAQLAAKQFAVDHFSGLCQEVVAWHHGVAPIDGSLLSQLATICVHYCESDSREELGAAVEAVVVQTALLYGAGAETTSDEAKAQIKDGYSLSLELDAPTH